MRDYTVNLGDANFPSINWDDCSATNDEVRKEFKFTQTLRDAFLTQHIDEPIRITAGDKPSLLYIVLTDASLSDLHWFAIQISSQCKFVSLYTRRRGSTKVFDRLLKLKTEKPTKISVRKHLISKRKKEGS